MTKHPVILELELQAYTAPSGHADSKYLGAAKKLVEQGDIAYLEGGWKTAYICYFGLVKLYTQQKSAISSLGEHVMMAMDRLEELVPKIVAEADKVGGVSAQNNPNQTPEEAALAARMAKLTIGGGATSGGGGGGDSMSQKYNDVQSQPQLTNTTIGMATTGGLAGLSNRIFTAGQDGEIDKRSFVQNEGSYGLGTGTTADYRAQKSQYAQNADGGLPTQDFTQLRENVGAIFPGQALDARQSTGYLDGMTKPVEKAKYNPNLKRLHVPTAVIRAFLGEATADLKHNVETCGILYGHKYHEEYTVKGLVLPEQDGHPDKCMTKNEERLIDVISNRGYVILGWIHTHPSWDPFLSSIDLHCQASYQQQIPEAIAVVCSQKNGQNAIFTLSEQGLAEMRSCGQPVSRFHQHSQAVPLFDNANHCVLHYPPGHERYHEPTANQLVPPPPTGVANRVMNWALNEGLRRYEAEVIDLRRGRGDERWYVFPERKKWITGHKPSGGHDLPRRQQHKDCNHSYPDLNPQPQPQPQPYNPYGNQQQQQQPQQSQQQSYQPQSQQYQPQQQSHQPQQQSYQPQQQSYQPQQQSYQPQQPQQQQYQPYGNQQQQQQHPYQQQNAYPANNNNAGPYSNLHPHGNNASPYANLQPQQQPQHQPQHQPQQHTGYQQPYGNQQPYQNYQQQPRY